MSDKQNRKKWLSEVTRLFKAKNYEEALKWAVIGVEVAGNKGLPWMWHGLLLRHSGNAAAAIQSLNNALSYCPEDEWNYYHRGLAHLQLHHYQAAMDDFSLAIEHNDDWSMAIYELEMTAARIHEGRADYKQAQNSFDAYAAYSGRPYIKGHGKEGRKRRKSYEKALKTLTSGVILEPEKIFLSLHAYICDLRNANAFEDMPPIQQDILLLGNGITTWKHGFVHFLTSPPANHILRIKELLEEIGAKKAHSIIEAVLDSFPATVDITLYEARREWIWSPSGKEITPSWELLSQKMNAQTTKICRKMIARTQKELTDLAPPPLISWK